MEDEKKPEETKPETECEDESDEDDEDGWEVAGDDEDEEEEAERYWRGMLDDLINSANNEPILLVCTLYKDYDLAPLEPERVIMATTGHRSEAMVRQYIRSGSLFEESASRYLKGL